MRRLKSALKFSLICTLLILSIAQFYGYYLSEKRLVISFRFKADVFEEKVFINIINISLNEGVSLNLSRFYIIEEKEPVTIAFTFRYNASLESDHTMMKRFNGAINFTRVGSFEFEFNHEVILGRGKHYVSINYTSFLRKDRIDYEIWKTEFIIF